MLVLPIAVILYRTFENGFVAFFHAISTPAAISALNMS
ncbi:sulfate ABC transporter, partial [Rhodococcus hoagii]|nr:sulfate ABC transporter [Prescottella equi]